MPILGSGAKSMGRPKASKTRGPFDARVTYTVVYERNEHDGYTVTVPALPGLVTEGKDMKAAKAMAREAITCYLKGLVKDGESIPREEEVLHDTVTVAIPEA
jgi:antitoxin HicB